MKNTQSVKQSAQSTAANTKQRSYNEVVDYLDTHWTSECSEKNLAGMKMLDKALGNISQKVPTILVTGINGKSLTAHFVGKLLKEEGLSIGTFYSPHILTYNERFALKNETITNKVFTDIANEVINTVETASIAVTTREILAMMALVYFNNNAVDVAVLEVSDINVYHPLAICNPKIVAITRISELEDGSTGNVSLEFINTVLHLVKPGTQAVSADQSKLSLQTMQTAVEELNGLWVMPIRKLAPLVYPFEQLHGRCAALAERIAQIYIESIALQDTVILTNSLLAKQQGQRGRPTLEAKRQSELNPKRTVEQFWKETTNTLPGRFQFFDKEKPMILLDNASNLDALSNLLLGIRLLHYQRSLKGLVIIADCNDACRNMGEFLRLLRYFFKKTSGQIIICQTTPMPGDAQSTEWDAEKVANDIKSMKIKAHAAKNFQEAFEMATGSVDERNGLIVVTGSSTIINNYWQLKGIKKV